MLQALQAQLSTLHSAASELRELRSSAYATVHRLRQALTEQGAVPDVLPDGCEPGSLPQQLRQAVDQLLSMLQARRSMLHCMQVVCTFLVRSSHVLMPITQVFDAQSWSAWLSSYQAFLCAGAWRASGSFPAAHAAGWCAAWRSTRQQW